MTFTFKISRRLALGHLGLAAAALVAACSGGEPTAPIAAGSSDPLAAVRIAPKRATIETNQRIRYYGSGISTGGDSMAVSIEWTATGGSISPDGDYSASTAGNYRVIGKGKGHNKSDTSIVVVVPSQPTLVKISVSPDPATVAEGSNVTFSARGTLSDGSTSAIGVVWTATGGTIDAGGTYTAGMTPGTFRVVAANTSGTVADTVATTVTTPQLSSVVLVPDTATLAPGATKQFRAYGRTATGDSIATAVSFSATGGAVTSGGLYTAGSTIGTYRVIAINTASGLSDTSVVTIQTPALAQLFLVPAVASVAAGGTLQFQVYGRTSAGDSVGAQATFTATGGAISSGGLYTAGSTGGSYRVIATQVGGTKADTAAITVTTATSHAGWYVAPNGSSGGAGSSASPWSLAYALSGGGSKIQPGDTVWLRGGTYNAGALNATLRGAPGSPVIVREYPGEHAAVNGTFSISGADVWYWGFEQYTNTLAEDVTGFNVQAARVKLINLVIHDNSGNGIGAWSQAPDAEIIGCVLYNNGYWGSSGSWPNPESWGHGMYVQNTAPATKLLRQNVVYQTFGYGFHLYTQGDHVDNITVLRNTIFANGMRNGTPLIVHSGTYPTTNTVIRGNWSYSALYNPMIWFYGDAGVTITVDSNRSVGNGGCYRPFDWASGSLTFRGNVCQGSYSVDGSNDSPSSMAWSGNTWYGNPTTQDWRWNGALYTFSAWRSQTGLGSSDTYVNGPAPAATMVQVNPYENGRGTVSIYNPSGAGSVPVDISGITGGGAYCIRHVYAANGACAVSGTGSTASFPMTGFTPPTPYNGGLGWNGMSVPQALPTFGAFIVSRD